MMSLYMPQGKYARFGEEKNLLPFPKIGRFSQPIAQSLYQLSYTGSQLFMMQKFLQKAIVIGLVKKITAFRKPQIHYHLINATRWILRVISQLHPVTNSTAVSQVHFFSSKTSQQPFNCCSVRAAPGGAHTNIFIPRLVVQPCPISQRIISPWTAEPASWRSRQQQCHKVGSTASSGQAVRYMDRVWTVVNMRVTAEYPAVWPAMPKFRQCIRVCSQL
jgi:hypothetical protein